MGFIHGKNGKFTLNSVDLSTFMNSIKFSRKADSHDVTTYGKSSHVFQAGLKDATIDIEGVYDDGTTGPGATLRPLVGGASQAFEYDPEGATTGNPKVTGNCIVLGYDETVPVAGMITWAASLQVADDLTDGTTA